MAVSMATSNETLDDNAGRPKRVKTSTSEVEQFSLAEQMEYERYKAGKIAREASSSPFAGLRIAKAKPGGTV